MVLLLSGRNGAKLAAHCHMASRSASSGLKVAVVVGSIGFGCIFSLPGSIQQAKIYCLYFFLGCLNTNVAFYQALSSNLYTPTPMHFYSNWAKLPRASIFDHLPISILEARVSPFGMAEALNYLREFYLILLWIAGFLKAPTNPYKYPIEYFSEH